MIHVGLKWIVVIDDVVQVKVDVVLAVAALIACDG